MIKVEREPSDFGPPTELFLHRKIKRQNVTIDRDTGVVTPLAPYFVEEYYPQTYLKHEAVD